MPKYGPHGAFSSASSSWSARRSSRRSPRRKISAKRAARPARMKSVHFACCVRSRRGRELSRLDRRSPPRRASSGDGRAAPPFSGPRSGGRGFQEACLRALMSWPKNGPPRDTVAWLVFVGRNAALDGVRRRSRERELPREEALSDLSDAEGPPRRSARRRGLPRRPSARWGLTRSGGPGARRRRARRTRSCCRRLCQVGP
jgi:Sigma-70 region 2